MISNNELDLLNFFIFNPKYGQREGEEHKKILFYYPDQTNIDTQLKNAGLCEALIKFTESFKPDRPCQSFHTKKSKQFLHEAEKDFWLVMTIGVPGHANNSSGEQSNEDNSHLIQENVFEAVLKKSYRIYKIFHGTYTSVMIQSDSNEECINKLKDKLGIFYNKYISNLKLSNCDILDVFQGISFLPLRKEPFLHVQCFINLIETKFKPVKYSAFLYNDQLIWSGINSEDMQIIYQYLIFTLLPPDLNLDLEENSMLRGPNSSVCNFGRFVTKPKNLLDSSKSASKAPKVYLSGNGAQDDIYHLVVYQFLSATLCLFIDVNNSLPLELFKSLESFLSNYLAALVSEVSEHCVRNSSSVSSGSDGPKVLYFNKLNLAQKSTMHTQTRKSVSKTVPNDILRMISQLNAEKSDLNSCGEVMCLTLNESWLVGRYSNSREFYATFLQKKGNLSGITDEVKKLCDSQLKEIFFTE